jgi:hypothetical protein
MDLGVAAAKTKASAAVRAAAVRISGARLERARIVGFAWAKSQPLRERAT